MDTQQQIFEHEPADLVAARAVAREVVAQRYPHLAAVEPSVTPRPARATSDPLPRSAPCPQCGYTFTFCADAPTPDGYARTCIARITVDSQRRVVKSTISK